MSCPSCQVAGRRLPSLPLGYITKARKKILCKEFCDIRMMNSGSVGFGSANIINTPPLEDVEGMEEYLEKNPKLVEEFVLKNVSQDQLERWLIRKSKNSAKLQFKRGGSAVENLRSFSNWKFCVHKDKRKLLDMLTKEINEDKNKIYVTHELVMNIAGAIHASRYNLYLVDETGKYLSCYADNLESPTNFPRQDIKSGATVSAYVARAKSLVYVTEVLGDERFPAGTGRDGTDLSVICHPLCESNGDLFGVVEFVREARSPSFAEEDVEIACSYLTWGSIALHYAEVSGKLGLQSNVMEFVNKCSSSIGNEVEDMEELYNFIIDFGKEKTRSDHFIAYRHNADDCTLFSAKTDFKTSNENPFEFRIQHLVLKLGDVNPLQRDTMDSFPDHKNIAGHVFQTGKLRNVKNAYTDELFCRTIDQETANTTKTVLAARITVDGSPCGVLEYYNKSGGVYNYQDEEMIKLCASFYGLALTFNKKTNQAKRNANEALVLKEILTHQGKPRRKDLKEIVKPSIVMEVPDDFYKYSFNFYKSPHQNGKWCFMMATDMLKKCQISYCEKVLIRMIATAKKHYRDLPYHNWEHAFSVSHFMYVALQKVTDKIPPLESGVLCLTYLGHRYKVDFFSKMLALFFACICHDLDHRGRNNAFYLTIEHPLADLYETSVLENHHYYMTKHILDQPECDVFSSFDKSTRKQFFGHVKNAILATDLIEHFKHRDQLKAIFNSDTFDWKNEKHRHLALFCLMTNSDLCGSCKHFEISNISATNVFKEFYEQGDEEIALGHTPIPMFTRKNEMPLNQAGFLNAVVKPCVSLLKNIIPSLSEVEDQINLLLDQWEEVVQQLKEGEEGDFDNELKQLRIPGSEIQEKSLSFITYSKGS